MEPTQGMFQNRAQQISEKDETVKKIIQQYPKELVDEALRRIDKTLAQEILGMKKCPLIKNNSWQCGAGLRKGEETWCTNIQYINCGSYDRYLIWCMIKKTKEKRNKKENV
jgi:hypothetical protein